MGFISGSVSFTRFRLVETPPDSLWAEVPERLKKHAFLDIDETIEERYFGWVNFDEMLDNRWEESPPEKGEYLTFSLRLDTRRISPAVFKKHLKIRLKEEIAQAGLTSEGRPKGLSKDRKTELRDQVRLKLMARTLPIPATFDVVWNIREQLVYLASTRAKVLDMFQELFATSFDLHLEALTPYVLGLHLLGEEAQARLDAVEAESFI